MRRVVSLFLPTWPTDRQRRKLGDSAPPAETPIVMIGREGRRRVVLAADHAAQQAGLRVGIPATKAQALVPGLIIEDIQTAADAEALDRLALWALQRYAPIAAADTPDGLVIDVTGAAHLHGGEEAMVRAMVDRCQRVGFSARGALADTWGAAHALARFAAGPVAVVPPGENERAIGKLPVTALRLPTNTVAGLRVLGFRSIADLAAQPRAPLTLRFGPELGRRLDQAMGRLAEPIAPIRPPDFIEVRRVFAEPIAAAETIARYIGKLAVALSAALEAKAVGARRLDLLCHRVDNQIEAARVGTATPVRDAKRLTRLLCEKSETIDPGFGIEIMSLSAPITEPLGAKQSASSFIEEPDADVSDLIDILSNRVGRERVYRFAAVASEIPERAIQRVAPMSADGGPSWNSEWPRPSRLIAPPELIETVALLPDHPPVSFTWRGVRRRVKRADGPERIFGEWWKRDQELLAVRDYFRLEDEAGERFWVFRTGDGEHADTGSHRWFLHGIFG